jgi:hypothetical protein
MKGFYDNILPKSLDKLGKKFGAKWQDRDGWRRGLADGHYSSKCGNPFTTKGQPLFAVPAIGAGLLGAGMMQEEEQF